MKLISLTCAVAASFSPTLAENENYSLWPRRPEDLATARRLIQNDKGADALDKLRALWVAPGVSGREARELTSYIQLPRYLSRANPRAFVYKVKRGETLEAIARAQKCPLELILWLNGIVDPSRLRQGQELVLVALNFDCRIDETQGELTLWDGEELIASYALLEQPPTGGKNETTQIKGREGYIGGGLVSSRSANFPSSDKCFFLGNSYFIAAKQNLTGRGYRLNQRDLNELALLLRVGLPVTIIRESLLPEPKSRP